MLYESGTTWKTTGCCSRLPHRNEHDENIHFSTSHSHYSVSHWARTHQNNRKLTRGDDRWEMCVFIFLHVRYASACVIFAVSLQRACSPQMAHRAKNQRTKTYSEAPVPMHKNCSPPASWFAWLSTALTSEWHDTIWEMMNMAARQLYQRWLG